MTNSISFKAKYINTATIKRCSEKTVKKEIPSSFVELEPDLLSDKLALVDLSNRWNDKRNLLPQMLEDFYEEAEFSYSGKKYYVLTFQKHLEKLKAKKILGIAEVIKGPKRIKLKFLQADPHNNYESDNPKYKGIGSAIINSIKTLYPNEHIIVTSLERAVPFYESHGFIRCGDSNELTYSPSKKVNIDTKV